MQIGQKNADTCCVAFAAPTPRKLTSRADIRNDRVATRRSFGGRTIDATIAIPTGFPAVDRIADPLGGPNRQTDISGSRTDSRDFARVQIFERPPVRPNRRAE